MPDEVARRWPSRSPFGALRDSRTDSPAIWYKGRQPRHRKNDSSPSKSLTEQPRMGRYRPDFGEAYVRVGSMLWFIEKRLFGSYFALIVASRL